MGKKKDDRFGAVRLPKELIQTADQKLKGSKDLQDLGFHNVSRWVTYLIQRELDRYCPKGKRS